MSTTTMFPILETRLVYRIHIIDPYNIAWECKFGHFEIRNLGTKLV